MATTTDSGARGCRPGRKRQRLTDAGVDAMIAG